jgi:hypothetical protein
MDLPDIPRFIPDPAAQESFDRVVDEGMAGGQEMACEAEEARASGEETFRRTQAVVQQPSIAGLWETLQSGGHTLRELIDPTRDVIHVPERRAIVAIQRKLEEFGVLPFRVLATRP